MKNTKEILKKFDIKLTKSLGQNFLTDESVVKKIVDAAEVNDSDLVIEVGPGIGSMTRELATRAGRLAAVEIDRHLIPALTESLQAFSNILLINRDILKVNVKEEILDYVSRETNFVPRQVKVVANLPYYITTPIIMKFLEENPGIDSMVFMVQKEVADRMAAKPGGKDYGALSVAVQYYSSPEKVMVVPPHCFIPQPEVDSTVVKLNIYKNPPVEVEEVSMFFKTVKAAFGQRRKTLLNALSNASYFNLQKTEIAQILKNVGIEENRRGETLTIMQFAEISNAIFKENLLRK